MLIEILAGELLGALGDNSIQILHGLGVALQHGSGEALGKGQVPLLGGGHGSPHLSMLLYLHTHITCHHLLITHATF